MNNNLIRRILLTGVFLVLCMSCHQNEGASNEDLLKEIVDQIMQARSTKILIQPVSKTNENLSLEEAYEIQVGLSKEISKSHGPIVGYKLGYSDSSAFTKNNISVPAYGPIFKNQIKNSGETISASDFHNFSIENEIVFTIAKTIDQKLNSIGELLPFVKSVHIGFDMSETVFASPSTIVDFVVDAGGSKYFVLSEGLDPEEIDVSNIMLSAIYGDSTIYTGTTRKVLGNPWFALREVANDLVERGYPLKAGDVIFSGKVAPAYKMQSKNATGLYKGTGKPFPDIQIWVK